MLATISNEQGRSSVVRAAIAIGSIAAALLLRWTLDPILQNTLPLVTLYGAVAIAVWYCRWRLALVVSLLGYLVASYLFIPPRHEITFALVNLVGLISYLVSCAIILYFGERMHRASDRFFVVSQSRKEVEDTLAREKELLATTLASIGDAVIVTDPEGRILSLNGEAERLTGWKDSDAKGKAISGVFQIIDERTRKPAESPVERALHEGIVVGLANHTVLISKDGREVPIDDSAAPIRRAGGPVLGVALVFRDVTEQRQAQQARA